MSKAVLISIRPKWCERIISGEKTIEVRKTRPKLEPPFKCYIYKCGSGKVIEEFLCDQIIEDRTYGHNEEFYRAACMSAYDAAAYAMQSPMYGWHISDPMRIYDTPRELGSFRRACKNDWWCESCAMYSEYSETCGNAALRINRPPQSWCYVEEQEWND